MKSQHTFGFQAVICHGNEISRPCSSDGCRSLLSSSSLRSAARNENKDQSYVTGHSSVWHSVLFQVAADLRSDVTAAVTGVDTDVLSSRVFALPALTRSPIKRKLAEASVLWPLREARCSQLCCCLRFLADLRACQ